MLVEVRVSLLASASTITPRSRQLHQICQLVMVHLHDRAVDEAIATLMTSRILATLDELTGSL